MWYVLDTIGAMTRFPSLCWDLSPSCCECLLLLAYSCLFSRQLALSQARAAWPRCSVPLFPQPTVCSQWGSLIQGQIKHVLGPQGGTKSVTQGMLQSSQEGQAEILLQVRALSGLAPSHAPCWPPASPQPEHLLPKQCASKPCVTLLLGSLCEVTGLFSFLFSPFHFREGQFYAPHRFHCSSLEHPMHLHRRRDV